MNNEPVNILLVDDQPTKLMTYEVILGQLGENLIKVTSGTEALQALLKNDIAVVLVDVCMPELDGFELAGLIRGHPRYQRTAIIFVSAVHLTDLDYLRGYESGAVDYVPVPVVPELLRAKVRIFVELYRKTRQLELLNADLEHRVAERTAELEESMLLLRESEKRRSLALAAGRMGSWEWDLVTDAFEWDEGQYRIFGVAPETFVPTSTSIFSLLHPDDANFIRGISTRAINDGHPYDGEFRIIRPDGNVRWCLTSGAPTLHADGRAVRLSGVTLDITERKRAEEGLQQLNEVLERRIEERTRERELALAQLFEAQKIDTIGQITGGVAHDFNNLLMAILGSLELLRKRLPEDQRVTRLLDNAVKGAEHGAALTQRLLAFARRQDLKLVLVNVCDLIVGMMDLVTRAVGPSVLIETQLPTSPVFVRIDANQFELALLNLAVNARDAMPNGGHLHISAEQKRVSADMPGSALSAGDYVVILFSDTGTGMDEMTLSKATEPFFTTKGLGKGTGLGLSMVQGITMQSGGALNLRSRPGEGTIVELWLPQAEPGKASGEEQAVKRDEVYLRQNRSCTVLVVDDDILVRTGTAAMLEDLGHIVIEACSGPEALELLKANCEINLVVTDHAMPGMTGLELARLIRRHSPNLPIVLISGYAELSGDEPEGAPFPRLAKPFRQSELAAAIAVITSEELSEAASTCDGI